jgi:CubicO group peptidase (beta-lactamase class C family)
MPDRAWHAGAWHSAGSGMFGTAGDYLHFLMALVGGEVLAPETLAAATVDLAAGVPMPAWNLGKGHGLFSGLLVDPRATGLPHNPGRWEWSGLYGTSWFVDPVNEICVVALTNTALEGCLGKFPRDVAAAIYAG